MKKYTLLMISLIAFVGCDQKSTPSAESKAAEKPAVAQKADESAKSTTPTAEKKAPTAVKSAPKPTSSGGALAAPSPTGGLPAPKDVAAPPADAKKTASGLAYKVLTKGKGTKKPVATDIVKVHYTGWTTDGKMFDSSLLRGQPTSFALNQVIPGWTEGLALMVEGEKTRLWIPESIAYKGQAGKPAGMLVFDVELLSIEQPQAFEAFLKIVEAGATKICDCKDMDCAQAGIKGIQAQIKPPFSQGILTKEQNEKLDPINKKLSGCMQKLQAASISPEEAKKEFEGFLATLVKGSNEVCACKDVGCATMVLMKMQQQPQPKGQPTPEQIKILMPHIQKIDGCMKKLQAAAGPAAMPGSAAPAPAPAPAKK